MVHSQPPVIPLGELVLTPHSAWTRTGEAWEVFPSYPCQKGVLLLVSQRDTSVICLPPTPLSTPPPYKEGKVAQGFPTPAPRVHYSGSQCREAGRGRALLFPRVKHIAWSLQAASSEKIPQTPVETHHHCWTAPAEGWLCMQVSARAASLSKFPFILTVPA